MRFEELKNKLDVDDKTLLKIILKVDPSYVEKSGEKIAEPLLKKIEKHLANLKEEKVISEEIIETEDSIGLAKTMTVKSFAEILKLPLVEVMTCLVKNGFMMNLNSVLDFDIMGIIADELGKKVHLVESQDEHKSQIEEGDLGVLLQEKDKSGLIERPPIISVIGHVDHGKTSLLDYIRKSNVASKEAGLITQSIGAYQVDHKGKKITFLDTPGHEAFVAMRRRGVRATDVAILVVAADDGVKAQTLEAIHHAKEAGVPIIVAISKIDVPGANLQRVKEQLAENNILIEEWGGEVIAMGVSAKSGEGIDKLLESIILLSEMAELKANPNRTAVGTVIESNLDQKMGAQATMVIHTGTLRPREIIVIGEAYGKVRALLDYNKKNIEEAGPSTPVLITGLSKVPQVGDILRVVSNEKMAREMASNLSKKREEAKKKKESMDIELVTQKVKEKSIKGINVILRADTEGSLEAIKSSLARIKTRDAHIRIIRTKTGDVNMSDLSLAQITDALIVIFNVSISADIESKARDNKVECIKYNVIYKLVEDLTARMLSSLEIEYEEISLGEARILKIFLTKKEFMICGIDLYRGIIKKGIKAKVIRDKETVGEVSINVVQAGTKEVQQLEAKTECGISLKGCKILEGDKLELFEMIIKKAELVK